MFCCGNLRVISGAVNELKMKKKVNERWDDLLNWRRQVSVFEGHYFFVIFRNFCIFDFGNQLPNFLDEVACRPPY